MNEQRFDLSRPVSELHSNERVKQDSRFLRGTLEQSLADPVTGAIDEVDTLLTKFFGIYQQDNRDVRDERRRAKLEPDYQFMVRVRLPGGVCTPAQWLALDALAREYGGGSLRLTTRQTFQFHGIRKPLLRRHIQGIKAAGLDTIAACGDDNRNVICTANPLLSPAHAQVSALAKRLSEHLLPQTGAYREIFLGQPAAVRNPGNEEPIYGDTYLPRKFKIALAVPPQNDVDLFAHDLGFIAIVRDDQVVGYNVAVGGGMGMTHKNPETFPRLSELAGFCEPNDVLAVAEQSMRIQREFGNRHERAHARFKYTIEDRGIEWFRNELETRLDRRLQAPKPFVFAATGDRFGWCQGSDGGWHYTLFVENGRLAETPDRAEGKTMVMRGLRAIAGAHQGVFALTTNQNVIIAGVAEDRKARIDALLSDFGIANQTRSTALRRHALACVAFPTCGLAMAESERYMPTLLDKLDQVIREVGLDEQRISVRMSGCPNGCSRPYLAEIGLVGKAPGKYNLYLGADASGERLNALYGENIGERQILEILQPLIRRYAAERIATEGFGDFLVRNSVVQPMLAGRDFQRVAAVR